MVIVYYCYSRVYKQIHKYTAAVLMNTELLFLHSYHFSAFTSIVYLYIVEGGSE